MQIVFKRGPLINWLIKTLDVNGIQELWKSLVDELKLTVTSCEEAQGDGQSRSFKMHATMEVDNVSYVVAYGESSFADGLPGWKFKDPKDTAIMHAICDMGATFTVADTIAFLQNTDT